MKRDIESLEDFYERYGVDAPKILLKFDTETQDIIAGAVAEKGFVLSDIKRIRQLGHGEMAIDIDKQTIYVE